jgi:hypothetical protein
MRKLFWFLPTGPVGKINPVKGYFESEKKSHDRASGQFPDYWELIQTAVASFKVRLFSSAPEPNMTESNRPQLRSGRRPWLSGSGQRIPQPH